jgi:multiple sugar transport system permease protein
VDIHSEQIEVVKIKQLWRVRVSQLLNRVLFYVVAISIAVISIFPLIWTVSTSLKTGFNVMVVPPRFVPNPISFQNYVSVLTGMGGRLPFILWFRNSVFYAIFSIFGEILFAAIAGYGFARFRFRLRQTMIVIMLSSAVVPGMVRMLPQYIMFSKWGWTNSYLPLLIPNWFGGTFLTFLFMQYFATIPRELDESAMIDGASHIDIFFRIIMPLSKPILSTAALLVFQSSWNKFMGPFIYLHDAAKYTLAVGLRFLQNNQYEGVQKEPLLAAYAVLMTIPLLVVFFLFQKHFVQGIQLSASKG